MILCKYSPKSKQEYNVLEEIFSNSHIFSNPNYQRLRKKTPFKTNVAKPGRGKAKRQNKQLWKLTIR